MPNTVAVTPQTPRDRMVEAALAGLQASGLAGAGINQVVAASGAPKGSLYHYFPGGKSQLVREALVRFGDRRIAALERVFSRDEPADQKVRRALDLEAFTVSRDPRVTKVDLAQVGDAVSRVHLTSTTGVDAGYQRTDAWVVVVTLAVVGRTRVS